MQIHIPEDERKVTDEMVFEGFDLGTPGLEKTRKAYVEGDIDRAKKELVEYFRTRTNVNHFYDFREKTDPISRDILPYYFQASLGLDENIKDYALYCGDELMHNRYVSPGSRKVTWDFGENFSNELHYNPARDGKKMHRAVFSIFSRGQFLEYLMFLYHETNDSKVLEKYDEVLHFFFRTYPIVVEYFEASAGHLMESEDRDVMDLGWLCFVYTEMLYTKMSYDIDYHTTFELVKHLWFCGMQFKRYEPDEYRPYNHHYFERGITPLFLGLMFPEIPAFSSMKEKAADICRRHIREDFTENGGYSELSIAYWFGAAVGEMLFRNAASARLNGYQLLDEDTQKRIDGTFSIMYNLVMTGKRLPTIGDNRAPLIDPLLELAYISTGDEKYKTLLEYRKGTGPYPEKIEKFYADDTTGFVIGKSGVTPDANGFYMSAKVNCGISGHNHMDMLSIINMLRGKYFVNEPYSGTLYHLYTHGSHLRGWCYDMDSHNSVLCYGVPIQNWDKYANRFGVYRPDSPLTDIRKYEKGMYVSGYHYGYTYCSHERRVLFAENGSMIVRDLVNRGNRMLASHIQRWHIEPGVKIERLSDHTLLLDNDGVRYLWTFDRPEKIEIYRETELLSEFFRDEEIGYTIDVYFRSDEMDTDRAMLSNVAVLMLDVTDRELPKEEEILEKLEELKKDLSTEKALETLMKM